MADELQPIFCPNEYKITNKKNRVTNTSVNGISRDRLITLLKKYILSENIEESNVIAAEMLSSGYYYYLWSVIFTVYVKNIHLKNIGLCIWLVEKYIYLNTLRNKHKFHLTDLGDVQEYRNNISAIISILCLEEKMPLKLKSVKNTVPIGKISAGLAQHYYKVATATTTVSVRSAPEIFTALSQFVENMINGTLKQSFYWIEQLVNNKECQIKPIDNIKFPKSIITRPSLILWAIIYGTPELNTRIIDSLRMIFSYFLCDDNFEGASYCAYVAVTYVKYRARLTVKIPNIMNRHVIKQNMTVNILYKNLKQRILSVNKNDETIVDEILIKNADPYSALYKPITVKRKTRIKKIIVGGTQV